MYSTWLSQATLTRKEIKTENDTINTLWPLLKEIETAGFGVSSSPPPMCSNYISLAGNTLTINSTAAGNDSDAGAWNLIADTQCSVTQISDSQNVIIIDPNSGSGKQKVATTSVNTGKLQGCSSAWIGKVAYWMPNINPGYYQTSYSLTNYVNNQPAMCAPGTAKFSRDTGGGAGPQPVLDCVLAAGYRFGCVDKTTGALTWWADPASCTCNPGATGSPHLRLITIGMVIQDSPATNTLASANITLFNNNEGGAQTLTLTNAQRYYKWKVIKKTITLRNLE